MYQIRNTNKQKSLLEQDQRIFRTADLSVLWEIENKNTLWTTIKRYVQRKILYKIHKGLYSTVSLEKLDKYELGCAISGQLAYVSAETVLQNSGIIVQNLNSVTLFGKKKKEFEINGISFLCRRLNQKYLLNRAYIQDSQRFSIATPERAIADMLKINPRYYFDNQLAIDLKKINRISKEVGYI
ncbi:MAG: hypothetical protein AUJ41_04305 [Candidatus Pacebacteria bacterium CG1_02_43_31]|nr:MAG: hypothetical protein AUJ41_04305 [Candidatus Pacebacteria bacterium CG1_02_43_31]